MLFNSIHFLLFFPIVTLVYFLIPQRIRWLWLLIASYYFYMSWNPLYAILLACSTLITYLSGILIEKAKRLGSERRSAAMCKLYVALSFASNLAILFFFKYFDFALENINFILAGLGLRILQPSLDILLPVGISFYTFQALSYTMDVYRGEIRAEKNPLKYALFVSFFPQLVAGPIERSKNLLSQVNDAHYFDWSRVKKGLLLMLWGFFQKVVIADRAAIYVNLVFDGYSQFSGFEIALAVLLFAVQIYCDFAGYSDIAIGAAQLMGFSLMDNFRQPYFSRSIKEFWRRWHISLSTWFRDYLYIPLGGSRCSNARRYFNLMIVFLASGLWHGASWNYVVWGGLHGLYQVIGSVSSGARSRLYSRLRLNTDSKLFKLGQLIVTFFLVDLAWVFFRASSAGEALQIIARLFGSFDLQSALNGSVYSIMNRANLLLLLVCIAVLLLVNFLQQRVVLREKIAEQPFAVQLAVFCTAVFSIIIFGIYGPGYDASQFIYFQF